MAIVAQLVRASDCGPEGRGFDSRQSPQFDKKEVIEFLQKIKHIQALSIHISFKKRSARNQFSKLLYSDDKEV